MSQCDLIAAMLKDGHWHTVAAIHQRCGFSRLNSRVAELRKRGMDIECRHVPGTKSGSEAYEYRLVSPLNAPPAVEDRGALHLSLRDDGAGGALSGSQTVGDLAVSSSANPADSPVMPGELEPPGAAQLTLYDALEAQAA